MRGRSVGGTGSGPLDAIARQLWGPLLQRQDVRVLVGADDEPGWRTLESYWAVPDAARARMILPGGSRRLAAAAVSAYPGLRPGAVRVARSAVALALRAGLRAGRDRVRLQVRPSASSPPVVTPLMLAAAALGGVEVQAAVGVRRGANAKATLQLFRTADGAPCGIAKVAWEPQSTRFVEVERDVLTELAGGTGAVRVPQLQATGLYGDHPYIVMGALPVGVRRVGVRDGPTVAELLAVAPVVRRATVGSTQHFADLSARLRSAPGGGEHRLMLVEALRLVDLLEHDGTEVPISSRWHGDLVPWNVAREPNGRLWVWDWETCERDVVAGLDALHWCVNASNRPAPDRFPGAVLERASAAAPTLAALGLSSRQQAVAVAVYAAALIDRGVALAQAAGGWGSVFLGVGPLRGLARLGMHKLGRKG